MYYSFFIFEVISKSKFVFVTALLVIKSTSKSLHFLLYFVNIVRLFKPKLAFTKFKKETLFILGSIKYDFTSFLAIAKISPG
jgi:hypothetical protein